MNLECPIRTEGAWTTSDVKFDLAQYEDLSEGSGKPIACVIRRQLWGLKF